MREGKVSLDDSRVACDVVTPNNTDNTMNTNLYEPLAEQADGIALLLRTDKPDAAWRLLMSLRDDMGRTLGKETGNAARCRKYRERQKAAGVQA